MLQWAVGVFAVGAVGGLVLASSVLRGRFAPWPLSLLHAALGATGLVLTALVLFESGESAPSNTALTLPRFTACLMALGLAAALPAMAAGLYDFRSLDEAQVPHALRHMAAIATGWLGYAVALYLRRDALAGVAEPSAASIAIGLAGAAALGLGGWFGGELVYRYGAGRIEG